MHKSHRTLIKFLFLQLHTPIYLENLPYTHGIVGFVSQQLLYFFQDDDLKLAAK